MITTSATRPPLAGSYTRPPYGGDYLIYAPDLSQIEMRIAADLSGDPTMISVLSDPKGDIHDTSAKGIYGHDLDYLIEFLQDIDTAKKRWKNERYLAKTIGFGVLYKLTAHGLVLRTPTLDLSIQDAERFIDGFYNTYARLRPWQQEIIDFTRRYGYAETLLKRRRYLPDITANDGKYRSEAERAAVNVPIQGSAADYFKLCMNDVHKWLKQEQMKTCMILQVHDEIVMEGPSEEKDKLERYVPEIMGSQIELKVPVRVDFEWGKSWGDLHTTEYWNEHPMEAAA